MNLSFDEKLKLADELHALYEHIVPLIEGDRWANPLYRVVQVLRDEAALAQQAQPLTDEQMEAFEANLRRQGHSDAYIDGYLMCARDRMAQQAQPEMPTREQIATAIAHAEGYFMATDNRTALPAIFDGISDGIKPHYLKCSDAVLALFRAEPKP